MIKLAKYFFVLLFATVYFVAIGQQSSNIMISPTGDTITLNAISILDISSKIIKFNSNQQQYTVKLDTSKQIYAIDTTAINAKDYLIDKKKLLDENTDELSLVKIENARREWLNYKSILQEWESTISQRIIELDLAIFNVQVEKRTWELTKASNKEQSIQKETLNKINEVIAEAKGLESKIKKKQATILTLRNKVTDFQIMVNEVLTSLDNKHKELQSDYFIQDSPILWKAGDSTIQIKNAKAQFKTSIEEHKKSVELFTNSNESKLIWHLFIFFFLTIIFYYLNILYKKEEQTENNNSDKIKYFLSHYISSPLLLSFSISLIYYTNIPATIHELILVLMLVPTIILSYAYMPKKMRPLLFLIVLLFCIDEMHMLFSAKSFITRIIMIFQDSLFLYIMFKLARKDSPLNEIYSKGWAKAITRLANVLIVVSILSMLANIIGFVNLSILLSNTLVSAVIAKLILGLMVNILNSLFVSLFKTKLFLHSNIIKSYGDTMAKKLHNIIVYLAIFFWVRSIFISLGIAEEFGNWLYGLMNNSWKIGSVNISFGGIIAFFLVIIITSLVTKGIKFLLEDEIFPRVTLGRGVPGAISMVVRYTIVAFGIYVALSAAGVDLGSFGLIAGALGVGIGFGLQGIVYNFIAGLILAFERPVQKGDTIQVGTLFGDVKEIGVRASKIQTYDGSTIIIPNGNLISNELTNWTFSKRVRRREIKVGVAYGSNPHDVMDLLFKVASENKNVLSNPKPWPIFEGFGDSSLNFLIRFWVNFDRGVTIQSEVAMEIYDALADEGITIPFPQTDLHVKSFDPTIQKTVFPFTKEKSEKVQAKKPSRPKIQKGPE